MEVPAAIKSAAKLTPQSQSFDFDKCNHERPWYEQEREMQCETAGVASTSTVCEAAARPRDRVKFAAADTDEVNPCSIASHLDNVDGCGTPVAVVSTPGFFSFTRSKLAQAVDADAAEDGACDDADATTQHGVSGADSRAKSHKGPGRHHHVGFDSSAGHQTAQHHSGAGARSQAASESGSHAASEGPSRSHSLVAGSGMSATLKGLFGGASSKLFGSLLGSGRGSTKSQASEEEEEELWFTSLEDFRPICHQLHRGRYMTAYFACAIKTGQHFLLKKFDKHKMLPAEERGVRRAIAFSDLLQHPNLVRLMGNWESDDIIYVVEEYVGKGDILNDCISHPDKYTERHVAVTLAKPLLQALAHLHENNIIHRSVLPENVYMGLDDVLRLGHLNLAVDQSSDRPKSRTTLLDYMAPEMLTVRPHDEQELALVKYDSDDCSSTTSSDSSSSSSGEHNQQQPWALLHEPPVSEQLQLMEQVGPELPMMAAEQTHAQSALPCAADTASGQHDLSSRGQQQQQHHQHQQHLLNADQLIEQELMMLQQAGRQRSSKWMQQPAELEPSRQTSLDATALEQLHDAALLQKQPIISEELPQQQQQQGESLSQCTAVQAVSGAEVPQDLILHQAQRLHHSRRDRHMRGGHASWEYQDHYDEKADIWQLGCLLHEVLCGSMPFELDSKVESAGLSLWADVEVLPGSIPPDCADFIRQTLTKDPRLRPSAKQLLQHPWIARCLAGEPWRDPTELAAARRAAELATITGWLRHHWNAATAAAGNLVQQYSRGARVAPVPTAGQQQQMQQQQDNVAPSKPALELVGHNDMVFAAVTPMSADSKQ